MKKKRKGDIMYTLLSSVSSGIGDMSVLFEAFIRAGYGASLRKIEFERDKIGDRKLASRERLKEEALVRRAYYNAIAHLRRDGLLREDERKKFSITKKGIEKIFQLRKRSAIALPSSHYNAEDKKSEQLILVVFDIPEKERRKRDWLRAVLTNLDLKMIQKSVWLGKTKIPKEFLDDLLELKLTSFVQVLEIRKTGTLENVLSSQ